MKNRKANLLLHHSNFISVQSVWKKIWPKVPSEGSYESAHRRDSLPLCSLQPKFQASELKK